jgi:NAD(P)-dependent dehydrogenase (short-subunit alcohol dehydrogenase family)
MELDGQVAITTGAGCGIGRVTALEAIPIGGWRKSLRQIASNALDLPLIPAAQLDNVPVGVADEH